MKSHETLIAAQKALVLRQIGIDPSSSRVFESQIGGLFAAGALLRLPPVVAPAQQDPVTGGLFFMVGISEVGGPDVITG